MLQCARKLTVLLFCLFWAGAVPLLGQVRKPTGAAPLKQQLERLRVVGSALMIAAHPDDENTAVLAWCAQEKKVRTGYLSLTRGEGGQNLIGSEQGALLGVIRTQELLAARRVDGAEQFFTRAIDFGFSKTAEETMRLWGREQVLGDIVRVIREFRPDVVILRFSGTPRDGHGHHQSSSILGKEAFRAAADPARFPEQLKTLRPWQAKRLVWNGFAFSRQQENELEKLPARLTVDTGAYNAVLGVSYGELAGFSRSQHRSQGMGAPERRGAVPNYFFTVDGEPAQSDLFEGLDLSWNRLPGGAAVDAALREAAAAFTIEEPERAIPALMKARALIAAIDHPDARRKLAELDEAVAMAAGLWLDVSANREQAAPGVEVALNLTAVNRGRAGAALREVRVEGLAGIPPFSTGRAALEYNKPVTGEAKFKVPDDTPPTQPFWLAAPAKGNLYAVPGPEWIGPAENAPVLLARFRVEIAGGTIEVSRPVENRYVDRVRGELTRPFVVVPPVVIGLPQAALVFANGTAKTVDVGLRALTPSQKGTLRLEAPPGWKVTPEEQVFGLDYAGSEQRVTFQVHPPAEASRGKLRAVALVGGRRLQSGMVQLTYEHIPPQTVLLPAEAPLTHVDVRITSRRVGYVMGAGDEVPAALKEMGCEVTLLDAEALAKQDLSRFHAIVTGVRAFNTRADLRAQSPRLWDYVASGGTVVVQYNVLDGLFWSSETGTLRNIGPYPLKLSRERVTVEEAPVRFLNPSHPLLNQPNRITGQDFADWVQERGLYFPGEFDSRYEPLLEMNDPGESPLKGGILTAAMGKGRYVFTPLAFFRQLPAGVPGAYRLFANLVSGGRAETP
jgi:LmbE family N-acetylglucosaminyl deacetylase